MRTNIAIIAELWLILQQLLGKFMKKEVIK